MNKFFVYGTLKAGGRFGKEFDSIRTTAIPAVVSGFDLYSVKATGGLRFPAAVPGNGRIIGELHEYPEEIVDAVLKRMDLIEGYDETFHKGSLYIRKTTKVTLIDDGTTENAYFYQFNWPIDPSYKKITTGFWEL